MIMNKETIKNSVSLFLHCQKLIAKPKRLHYSELKSLLGESMTENEFNGVVKSIFNLADHYFLLEKHQHPTKLLIDINALADKIRLNMNPHQKLIFLTIVLKLIKFNKQENNTHLDRALFCIAEIFSYNMEQTHSIKKMFSDGELEPVDYADSILLTNQAPDYTKVIDGLKVIYNPNFTFKIWVKNIKSVNNMLFKILEYNDPESGTGIKAGDVLAFETSLQGLLEEHHVNLNLLSSKIISNVSAIPRIEIEPTERSPRIILNSSENRIEIEGISMINHPLNFFTPVFYWLEKIKETKPPHLSLHINLNFFNTYTSKIILKILQKAVEMESEDCKVKYYWYHEEDDEEIKEAGEHYASIINRQFTFISTVPSNLISA